MNTPTRERVIVKIRIEVEIELPGDHEDAPETPTIRTVRVDGKPAEELFLDSGDQVYQCYEYEEGWYALNVGLYNVG
jgi:hypothetical protein